MRALLLSLLLASSSVASAETLANRVAAVLGDRTLPKQPLDKAIARWAPLVELQDQGKTQQGRELTGTSSDVRWADVVFEATGKGKFWIAQVGLVPEGGDFPKLHGELVAALNKKLGKSRRDDDATVWKMPGGWSLWLYPAKNAPNPLSAKREQERVVYLELSAENND